MRVAAGPVSASDPAVMRCLSGNNIMQNLIGKIFSSKGSARKSKTNEIVIYLDSECKRSIETKNQTVESYLE